MNEQEKYIKVLGKVRDLIKLNKKITVDTLANCDKWSIGKFTIYVTNNIEEIWFDNSKWFSYTLEKRFWNNVLYSRGELTKLLSIHYTNFITVKAINYIEKELK